MAVDPNELKILESLNAEQQSQLRDALLRHGNKKLSAMTIREALTGAKKKSRWLNNWYEALLITLGPKADAPVSMNLKYMAFAFAPAVVGGAIKIASILGATIFALYVASGFQTSGHPGVREFFAAVVFIVLIAATVRQHVRRTVVGLLQSEEERVEEERQARRGASISRMFIKPRCLWLLMIGGLCVEILLFTLGVAYLVALLVGSGAVLASEHFTFWDSFLFFCDQGLRAVFSDVFEVAGIDLASIELRIYPELPWVGFLAIFRIFINLAWMSTVLSIAKRMYVSMRQVKKEQQ